MSEKFIYNPKDHEIITLAKEEEDEDIYKIVLELLGKNYEKFFVKVSGVTTIKRFDQVKKNSKQSFIKEKWTQISED